MTGLEQFLTLFGNITISKLVVVGFSLFFCYKIYRQIIKCLENKKELAIKKYEDEKEKDEKLNMVLEEVNKYPQYREQSRQIQKEFREEINGLKIEQSKIVETQTQVYKTLGELQQELKDRDKNKLQDRLLQSYRYYTDIEKNPSQTWSMMEAQAFWALFKDYEDVGGNGYMHSVVMPAMKILKVIDKE